MKGLSFAGLPSKFNLKIEPACVERSWPFGRTPRSPTDKNRWGYVKPETNGEPHYFHYFSKSMDVERGLGHHGNERVPSKGYFKFNVATNPRWTRYDSPGGILQESLDYLSLL